MSEEAILAWHPTATADAYGTPKGTGAGSDRLLQRVEAPLLLDQLRLDAPDDPAMMREQYAVRDESFPHPRTFSCCK